MDHDYPVMQTQKQWLSDEERLLSDAGAAWLLVTRIQ
jgi:hypothetical protein